MPKTHSFLADPHAWFVDLKGALFAKAKPKELIACSLEADLCDFARVSQSKLVQGSRVEHLSFGLSTGFGARRIGSSLTLPTDLRRATTMVLAELDSLRGWLDSVPEDPFYVDFSEPSESIEQSKVMPVPVELFFEDFRAVSSDLDVVGLYASGPMYSGWATSRGHLHWMATHRYFFDFSVYAQGDKAVKDFVSGPAWSRADYANRIDRSRPSLELLSRPAISIPKGGVRALLSAEAVSDLLALSSWGGYSARSHLTGESPFESLRKGGKRLSEKVNIFDDLGRFGSPRVQDQGYLRPSHFALIEQGRWVNWYCSPRTGKEYGLDHNLATSAESPSGLVMDAGSMPASQALLQLDTGLYVSNVWYLNYSDRQHATVTGMTRFASMWVEGGRLVGPIEPVRFNDSLLDIFGDKLVDLGDQQEVFESTSTYGHRPRGGVACPSLLAKDLQIVL